MAAQFIRPRSSPGRVSDLIEDLSDPAVVGDFAFVAEEPAIGRSWMQRRPPCGLRGALGPPTQDVDEGPLVVKIFGHPLSDARPP